MNFNKNKSHPKYIYDYSVFYECNSPETAYWLGFLMADGCVINDNKKRYQLILTCHKKDEEILKQFQIFLKTNKPIELNRNKFCILRIFSKQIVHSIYQYGIIPRKTGKEQIKNIPEKYYSDFIRGFLDGDGYIITILYHKKYPEKRCGFCSASAKILKQIQEIFHKYCDANINPLYKHTEKPHLYYELKYQGNQIVKKIYQYLYQDANIYLQRKYARW